MFFLVNWLVELILKVFEHFPIVISFTAESESNFDLTEFGIQVTSYR